MALLAACEANDIEEVARLLAEAGVDVDVGGAAPAAAAAAPPAPPGK